MNIRQLLLEYYLTWQKQIGEEKTWKDFAAEIGIDNVYLNKIYNGKRKAGEKTIQKLANFFNDPRFYDAVGMDRPEQLLTYVKLSEVDLQQAHRRASPVENLRL